jgi:dienelactone hydrolase
MTVTGCWHVLLRCGRWFVALLACASAVAAAAPAADLTEFGLQEDVRMIPASGDGVAELEVTLYRPQGEGPFPVAVINHGRSPALPHTQPRFRPLHVAYEFVRRGYAVVVPMRQGFSRSGGTDYPVACDVAGDARHQARSLRRAVDWAVQQPWADPQRIIVIGQSHGGLAALAYGEDPHPGTRLIVNFAGGIRKPTCRDWQEDLIEAIADFGRATRLPSLWFYGDNDSHFPPAIWRAAHERYGQRGGQARLVAFGSFGSDAHGLFGARDGVAIWMPPLLEQIGQAGLPALVDARFDPMPDVAAPPPLRQAVADEADHLPVRGRAAREGFLSWLRFKVPKAFVISEDRRHWASAWGPVKPVARALERCQMLAGARCRVFAVNGFVVWPGDSGQD